MERIVEKIRHQWTDRIQVSNNTILCPTSNNCLKCGIKREKKNGSWIYTLSTGEILNKAPKCI